MVKIKNENNGAPTETTYTTTIFYLSLQSLAELRQRFYSLHPRANFLKALYLYEIQ